MIDGSMPVTVMIRITLKQPVIVLSIIVLVLRGWESLKRWDGSKGQDIDNRQGHIFIVHTGLLITLLYSRIQYVSQYSEKYLIGEHVSPSNKPSL